MPEKNTEKKWERICPKCNRVISYTKEKIRDKQCKKGAFCRSCALKYKRTRHPLTDEHKRKLSIANTGNQKIIRAATGRKLADDAKRKISIANKGRKVLEATKLKLSFCNQGKKHSYETKQKLSQKAKKMWQNSEFRIKYRTARLGKKLSDEHKAKIRASTLGKKHSPETIEKIRTSALKRKHSTETIEKIRTKCINRMKAHGSAIVPHFNPNACVYFDKLSTAMNWKLQHALNGGEFYIKELGYWVDAYDKEKNIIVEYDEDRHYTRNQLNQSDVIRMEKIIQLARCQFYRYNEKDNQLSKWVNINGATIEEKLNNINLLNDGDLDLAEGIF